MPKVLPAICRHFSLSEAQAELLLRSAPRRYKVYSIPKRSGRGQRTIAQPAREIKILQRWALKSFIPTPKVHPCATAYEVGASIRENAAPHTANAYLLKLDFENFFNSIKASDFVAFYAERNELSLRPEDIERLAWIFFWKPRGSADLVLSIGAPSSPRLSNILMYDFDESVQRFCKSRGVAYTRYADDLSFSTNERNVLDGILAFVRGLCEKTPHPVIRLNNEKTVFSSRRHHRRITGVVLANDGTVSLGRDRKRHIRAQIYRYTKGWLASEDVQTLSGLIAFTLDIEPSFVERLRARFGAETVAAILRTARRN